MKKLNNTTVLIFIVTLVISIISYINFLPEYYSIDTTKIIKDGYLAYGMQYSIQDARIFSFIIFYIAELINISIESLWQILLLVALIISSVSVLKLYNIVVSCKPTENKKIKMLLYLIAYCFIFNFMYIDCIEFAENLIMSFSILFYIKSAEEIILKNKNLKGLFFCIIGILFYQGTLNIFISIAILFLLISKTKNKKEIIKKLIITGVIAILVLSLDFLLMDIIKSNVEEVQMSRLSWDLRGNLRVIIENISNLVINSVKLFPKFLQIAFIFIILAIMFIRNVQEKKVFKILLPICLILVCYLGSLGETFLTPLMLTDINGRMFVSIGIIVSTLLIYVYVATDIFERKTLGKAISIIIIAYFVINIANTIKVTWLLKEGNNIDREISLEIQAAIEEHEKETQIEVTKISVRHSIVEETERECLRSKRVMKLYDSIVYRIYTGEELEDTYFDANVRKQYFKERRERY